ADPRRAAGGGPALCAAGAAARLARRRVPVPRRHRRAGRRAACPRAPLPDARARREPALLAAARSARAPGPGGAAMMLARALAITGVLLVGAFATGEAAAHPLGNFSVNHMTQVKVS